MGNRTDIKKQAFQIALPLLLLVLWKAPLYAAPDAVVYTTMQQYKSDGTTAIATGGTLNETTVLFSVPISDATVGHTVKLQVEVRPTGGGNNFGTGPCVFTPSPVSWSTTNNSACVETPLLSAPTATTVTVTVNGLVSGSYHWRARAVDNTATASLWTCFGNNADSTSAAQCSGGGANPNSAAPATDFTVAHPTPPINLQQTNPRTNASIPVWATDADTLNDRTVVFSATNTDVDAGHTAAIQVEVLPIGGYPFSCAVFSNTAASYSWNGTQACIQTNVFSAGGAATSVTLTNLASGSYHWRARLIDNTGSVSPWTCFGGNQEFNPSGTHCPGGGASNTTGVPPVADFAVNHPAPMPAGSLQQVQANGILVQAGAITNDATVVFEGMVTDVDAGHTAAIQVEVLPIGGYPFSCAVFSNTAASYSWNGTQACIQTNVFSAGGAATSVTLTNLASGSYHWRARLIDNTGSVSPWTCFGGNQEFNPSGTHCPGGGASNLTPFVPVADFTLIHPANPAALNQYQSDGTTAIATAGTTTESTVIFKATGIDAEPGHTLRLRVEVQPTGAPFSCTAFTNLFDYSSNHCFEAAAISAGSATTLPMTIINIANGNYHWRAQIIDSNNSLSQWVCFGGNSDTSNICPGGGQTNGSISADFTVSANAAPNIPTALTQKSTTGTSLSTGATTTENAVVLGGTLTDSNAADTVRIQVEVQPTTVAFTNCTGGFNNDGGTFPCVQGGTAVAQGGSPSVTVSGLTNNTNYHWQARSIDNSGAVSAWQAYPATSPNADTPLPAAVDFRSSNQAPNTPANDANFKQVKSDGTTVITQTTNETSVIFKALISDPDGHDVQLAAEAVQASGSFTGSASAIGSPVVSGSVASVTVTGLSSDPAGNANQYKWQVWAIDKTGQAGAKLLFPTPVYGDGTYSFKIVNPNPSVAALTQSAVTTPDSQITLGGTITDPDSQPVKLQIEIRPVGGTYSCTSFTPVGANVAWNTGGGGFACGETALVSSGSAPTILFVNIPNGTYKWRARAVDQYGQPPSLGTSAWLYYPNSATDPDVAAFTLSNTAPTLSLATPTNGQFTTGSAAIATGTGTTNESSVLFKGTPSDPDAGQQIKIQVEARPTGAGFGCTSFSPATVHCAESGLVNSGTTASVTLGVFNNDTYHWRARGVDSAGLAGAWVCFGGNNDNVTDCPTGATSGAPATDFTVAHTTIGTLTQTDGAGTIAAGGMTIYESVTLGGTIGDPDAQNVKIQIEVRPASVAFTNPTSCASFDTASPTGAFCAESPLAAGGAVTRVFSLPNGTYHWRARTVDQTGSTGAWLYYPNSATDPGAVSFEVAHPWAVTPLSMTQFQSDCATPVAAGGMVGVPSVCLKGEVGDVGAPTHTVKLQVEVQPIGTAFTGLPNAESAASSVVAATPMSIVFTNLVDGIRYQWQARAIDSTGKTGPWQGAPQSGGFAFKIQNTPPSAPILPVAASQFQTDGVTAVGLGGTVRDSAILLKETVTDPDGNAVKLWVELRPTGVGFSCANPWDFFDSPSANACVASTPVASGSPAGVTLTNLSNGNYHWRARTLDSNGAFSPWVCFGAGANNDNDPGCNGSGVNDADLTVGNRAPNPLAGTDLTQYKKDGTTLLAAGGTTNDAELYLQSVVTEPDTQSVKTQVEVRPLGTPFSCVTFSAPPTCQETLPAPPSALDISSNKNNGAVNQGSATHITLGNPGKFGLGADFNGVGGNVAVPSASTIDNLGSAATLELWVQFNAFSATASQTLLEKKSGDGASTSYLLELLAGAPPARLRFTAGSAGSVVTILSDAAVTAAGIWYHVAVVYTGTAATSKIYIDGTDHTSGTPTGAGGALPVSTGSPLQIGAGRVDGSELISNPGFETGTCGTECAGPWVQSNGTIDPFRYIGPNAVVPYSAHGGSYFMTFPPGANNHANHTDLAASATQTITVTPNTSYRLSGWVLRDAAASGVTATMDLNGLPEGCSAGAALAGATWEPLTCYFTTGPLTASVTVRLHVVRPSLNTGFVLFDDISLKALSLGSTITLNGSVDDVRISNNLRYTANFTAPAAAFTSDANTVALYPFESWAVTQRLLFTGLANGNYVWRSRGIDADGIASAWASAPVDGSGNAFVINNRPPNLSTLQQYDKNGVPIALGGTIADTTVTIGPLSAGAITDPDPNQTLKMQVELRAVGAPFSCSAYTATDTPTAAAPCAESPLVASGSTLPANAFTYSGLSTGISYHWKAKWVDQYGATVQTCFGANNDADAACNGSGGNDADFTVIHPAPPTSLTQRDNMDLLATGATTPTGLVRLGGSIYDTDTGHTILIQVEVKPVGTAFGCAAFTTGDPTSLCQQEESFSTWTTPTPRSIPFQLPNGSYHWRVRANDGANVSQWVDAPVDGSGASFVINNQPPTAINTANLQQSNLSDTAVIAVGGTTNDAGVLFKANVSDPIGEPVKLQVEARAVGTPIDTCATFPSGSALSTSTANCAEGNFFSATILDSSGSVPLNNTSPTGGVRLGEPGPFATGARFNGVDGQIHLLNAPTLDSLGSTATLELWAKFNALTPNTPQTLIEKKNAGGAPVSYLLEVSPGASAGQLRFTAGTGGDIMTLLSNDLLTINTWTHIAVVYNGATPTASKIYINGADQTLSATGTGGALPSSPATLFSLGAASVTSATNLLSNPGFETGSLSPWVASGGASVNNAQPHSGTNSALFPTNATFDVLTQNVLGAGTTTYRLSAWVYSTLTAGTAGIDLNGAPGQCSVTATVLNAWQQIACNFTTGAANYAPTTPPAFGLTCCVSRSGSLYIVYTWVTSDGRESLPSPEAVISASYRPSVFVPAFPAGVVAANVYVSNSSGTGTLQSPQITTSGGSWTEPASFYTTTGSRAPSKTTIAQITPRLYVTRPSENMGNVYFDDVSLNAVSSTNLLNGSIDEVRISDITRYSAPFTPSGAPFASDGNTRALYHFDNWDATVTVSIPNLPGNTNYHWRARPVDQSGSAQSTWSCYGGNNDTSSGNGCNGLTPDGTDFVLLHPPRPIDLTQLKVDQTTVIGVGGNTDQTSIYLKATRVDPDATHASLKLQFEVKPLSQPFDGTVTTDTTAGAAGAAQIYLSELSNDTYHWRVRTSETFAGTTYVGDWAYPGGADGAHFVVANTVNANQALYPSGLCPSPATCPASTGVFAGSGTAAQKDPANALDTDDGTTSYVALTAPATPIVYTTFDPPPASWSNYNIAGIQLHVKDISATSQKTAPSFVQWFTSGGSVPNPTYVKYTWVSPSGESSPSAALVLNPPNGWYPRIRVPSFPTGVTAAKIYASGTSGSEVFQGTISVSGGSFDMVSLATGTASPPPAQKFKLGVRSGGRDYFDLNDHTAGPSTIYGVYPLVNGDYWTTNPDTGLPWSWADIANLVGVIKNTDAVADDEIRITQFYVTLDLVGTMHLTYANEGGYAVDGVHPEVGPASATYVYKVDYTHFKNIAPTSVKVHIDGDATGIAMAVDSAADSTLRNGMYDDSEQYVYATTLAAGFHNYYFTAGDGTTTVRLPKTGTLNMPIVDQAAGFIDIVPDNPALQADDGTATEVRIPSFNCCYSGNDSQTLQDIAIAGAQITSVQMFGVFRTDYASPQSTIFYLGMRVADPSTGQYTNYNDGGHSVSGPTTYASQGLVAGSTIYTTNPLTGLAWSWTDIKNLQSHLIWSAPFAGSLQNSYYTQIFARVSYTPLSLSYANEVGYGTDGLHPEAGSGTTPYVYKVVYRQLNEVPPAAGYPKVHIDTLPDPSVAPTLSVTCCPLSRPATTLYARYTWVNSLGQETLASPESSLLVSSNSALRVTVPAFPAGLDVVAANVYVSASAGTEKKQAAQITTSGGTWTEPGTQFTSTGAVVPATNNTGQVFTMTDSGVGTYAAGRTYTYTPPANSLAAGTTHRYYFDTLDAAASPLACLPSSGGSPCGTTQLSGPAVSLNAFQMVILPNQVSGCCITTWNAASATNLRSDDGGASVSSSNGSSGPNEILYLDMDNPTSVGLFIKSLTIKAKILNNATTAGASFRLGLRVNGVDYLDNGQTALGTAGTYGAYSGTLLYSNNPATGKPWTWGDIQNLITVVEHTDNTQTLTVSYLYVAVDLTPVQLDYSQEANYAIKGVSPDIGRSTTLFVYKTVYTHLNGLPPKAVRIHIDSDNVGSPTRPNDSGTGTASSNTLTDGSKNWTPNQWANFYLLDADWNSFLITSNTATVLTVSAGAPISGNYTIYSSPSKVNMVLDTGAASALQNGIYTDGEQYIYTTTLAAGTHDYYFETADGLYSPASTNKNWLPPSTYAGGTVQTGPIVDARASFLDLHPTQKNFCCVNSPLFTFGGTGDVAQRNPANALDAQDGNISYAASSLYGDRIDMDIDNPDLSYRYFYINSVQVMANIRDNGGGAATGVNLGMRVNGLDYSGAGTTITPNSTTYNLYAGPLYPVNPDTGMPWSWQDIDDLIGTVRHDAMEKGAAGVGGLNALTDTSKSWTAGQWTGQTLLDAAGSAFAITGNSATALTVSGTPASGAYTLYNNNPLYVTELFVRVHYSPVRLSYSPNSGYVDDGIEPNTGLAAATPSPTSFTYRTVYSQAFNIGPSNVRVYIDGDLTGVPLSEEFTATTLGDGQWDNGEHYTAGTTLPFAAAHSYRFDGNDGNDTASLPPLLLLHPSGQAASVGSSGWTFSPAGSEANALDASDADVSAATSSGLNDRLYMEIDDTSLKNDWTIRSVTLSAGVRAPSSTTFQMGVRINGVDYLNGSDIAAGAGYAVYSRVINSANPTLNPNTNLPWTWQEINDLQTVLVHTGNANPLFATEMYLSIDGVKSGPRTTVNPPQLSFSTESGYQMDADPNGKGVEPNSGSEGATFTYKVIYTHPDNVAPSADLPRVYIDGDPTGALMTLDTGAAAALHDGNYANGEQYLYTTASLLAGRHTYYFKVSDGINLIRLPATENPLSDPVVTSGISNTLILHPSSRNSLSAAGWIFTGTGSSSELGPDQALDFCGTPCNNTTGDGSYARSAASNDRLYMVLDKTTRTKGTITSVTVKAVARYSGASGSGIQVGLCLSTCKTADSPAAPATSTLTSAYTTVSSSTFIVNPETNSPWTWSEINQLVAWVHHATNANEIRVTELWAEVNTTNAAAFSYSPEGGYITDGVSPDGGRPDTVLHADCVGANGTCYLFKIVYSHGANLPPDAGSPQVVIDGVPFAMLRDVADLNNNGDDNDDFLLNDPLRDGDFTNGEQYVYRTTLQIAGSHTYSFKAVVGGGGGQTLQCVDVCPGIQTLIGPNTANQTPILTSSPEAGYGPSSGVLPTTGLSSDNFVFKIVYIHDDDNPPTSVRLFIDADPIGFPMIKDTAASNAALRDNNHTTSGSGEQYIATLRLAPGTTHTYFFTASDGNNLTRFPLLAGTRLSGPTVTDPAGAAGAPGAVTDLKVFSQTPTSVTLRWTAPGNNAASLDGKATAYDLRYSTKEIIDDSAAVVLPWQIKFSQIDPIADTTLDSNYHNRATGLPIPSAGGTLESFTINNLIPNTAYYIALKSLDETHTDPTLLPISNVINGTSLPGNPLIAATDPPIPVTDLLQGFNAISLPLLPAAPGTVESTLAGSLGTGLSVYPWTSTGPGITDGSYTPRLMDGDLLTAAKGYFVQAPDTGRRLNPDGAVNAAPSVTLPLLYGFNLIGNPYNHEVLLENTQIRCQGTIAACGGTADATKTFTAAVSAGWVENGIRLWNGSSYDFGTIVDVQKPTLRLWKGYWLRLLKNDAAYSMMIPKP